MTAQQKTSIFKKLESLADVPIGKLAGKMGVVIDLITRLPVEIWFKENAKASDINFEPDILNLVRAGTLLLLDRGFYHFRFWQQLIDKEVHIITRLKKGAAFQIQNVFTDSYSIRDRLIIMGSGTDKTPYITLRLIEIRSKKTWYSYATFSGEASPEKLAYLTSVVDPLILPPCLVALFTAGNPPSARRYVVANLYGRRWRIEEAFNTVKRLLGLSYLWTGSVNGIKLQLWGTWLFYSVLVDLGDAVADEMTLPFDRISLEMGLSRLYGGNGVKCSDSGILSPSQI